MFAFFESRIRPTALPTAPPPQGLLAFYWHFVRQSRHLFGALFVTGLVVALIDTLIPIFIGRLGAQQLPGHRGLAAGGGQPRIAVLAAEGLHQEVEEGPRARRHMLA